MLTQKLHPNCYVTAIHSTLVNEAKLLVVVTTVRGVEQKAQLSSDWTGVAGCGRTLAAPRFAQKRSPHEVKLASGVCGTPGTD